MAGYISLDNLRAEGAIKLSSLRDFVKMIIATYQTFVPMGLNSKSNSYARAAFIAPNYSRTQKT